MSDVPSSSGFDRIAAPYRALEYLTFGRALERTRFTWLRQLADTRNALVLGDGDGRFTARLLAAAPRARVHAVDVSAAMLARLQHRANRTGNGRRVTPYRHDLTHGLPPALALQRFDLVATHFFLDCLTQPQVDQLVAGILPLLEPHARWVVSEFAEPVTGPMRLPSRLIVRGLYLGFRMLTGLRTQRLPDYAAALQQGGFRREERRCYLNGLLTAEAWRMENDCKVERKDAKFTQRR